MHGNEIGIHSFIIKVWIDHSLDSPNQYRWHGYITHVPSGVKVSATHLEDILDFIRQIIGEEVFKSEPPASKQTG